MSSDKPPNPNTPANLRAFDCDRVNQLHREGNVWDLPGGQLLLPGTFGFCRGVERALAMLEQAVNSHARSGTKLFLLGEIIHNPWVNDYFRGRGVNVLTRQETLRLADLITAADCAVIPAFGVPLPVERQLRAIGCEIVDTSCGDVRRLWVWAERAERDGFGVVIFGRAVHDETVVTKSRLAEVGGKYLVLGNLDEVGSFCEMLTGRASEADFARAFGPEATSAVSMQPFERLAQVSQTTMLYNETMEVRRLIQQAFIKRFGPDEAQERLLFEPTVCRATQDRQNAAIELCRSGVDLVIVVGGFTSSNTRHLYELARNYAPTQFIEDADAIISADQLQAFDPERGEPVIRRDWLPARRPLRIGVLAGASCPKIVVGRVLDRLAEFLR